MEIDLPWTAAIAELKSMRSSAGTETAEITEIVETTVIILVFKKWLFKAVTVLDLTDTALTAAMIQDWQCLNCYSFSSVSMKT